MRLFSVLVAAYAVSTFGNFLNLVAVNLYVYSLTGSAMQTGLLMAARLAAGFVAGPVAGWLVTRFDRRLVMIACDVAQGVAMVSLLVTPESRHSQVLWAVAVVLGAGNVVFMVALRTTVPDLVGSAARVRGNGYLVTGRSLAMVLGFASAGSLIGEFGFQVAFAINAASFLVSALVLAWLPLSFRPSGGGAATSTKPQGTLAVLGGLRTLLAVTPVLAGLVALRGVEAWGGASHNVALPVFAEAANPDNPAALLSQFWTAWAVGSLAMYQVVSRWLSRTGHSLDERAYAVAACFASVAFVVAFADLPVWILVAVALVAGFADGFAELAYSTRLQAGPPDTRGLLFGISATAETLGLTIGMVASALLLEWADALVVVGISHGVVVVATCTWLAMRRAGRWPVEPRTDLTVGSVKA